MGEGGGGEGPFEGEGFVSISAEFLPGSDGPATAFKDHPETTSKLFEASQLTIILFYLFLELKETPLFIRISPLN